MRFLDSPQDDERTMTMSRVHYKNETIRKAMFALDDLEQTIGWNMRCAYPEEYRHRGENSHQGAMEALAQILEHFPMLRRLLDEVEAEVLKQFLEAAGVHVSPLDAKADQLVYAADDQMPF
jgi:hypothetical protein